MECHFLAPCAIHIENGSTGKARVFLEQTKGLSVFMKSSEETSVLFPREADHAQLRNHNRPTEDRYDSKKSEDNFSCDRRVIERKQQTAAGRYDLRNEHSRVTGISNNAVLQKCHRSFRPSRLIHHLCFVILVGKLGCLFAATIKAAPMTIRKNEKNWPLVNGPINSASGSRKFSTTIRKIE